MTSSIGACGTTLASLAAAKLVGKIINEPIPEGCADLIEKEKWLRSKTTVYYIPICYHPVNDELMEDLREEFEKAYGVGRGRNLSDFEFNKPVPKDYDFTIPFTGKGIADYEISDKICNPIIQLLQGNGVILKRGDIVRCEMFSNDGIMGSFIVDVGNSGTVDEKVTLHDCTSTVDLFRSLPQFKVLIDHPPMYFSSAFEQGFLTFDLDMFFEEIYASFTSVDDCNMIRSKITYDDITYNIFIMLEHKFMTLSKEWFRRFFEYKMGAAWMYQKLENNDPEGEEDESEGEEEDDKRKVENDRIYEFLKKQDIYTTIILRVMY